MMTNATIAIGGKVIEINLVELNQDTGGESSIQSIMSEVEDLPLDV